MGATIKKGIVFDIKKYATDDGPGIRTTIFLKGCPLRCWWCHNPEGQIAAPELMYKERRCNRCRECEIVCPKNAISVSERISIDRNFCNLCGKCSQKCPTEALMIIGKEMRVDEVIKEIDKDTIFYEDSAGGITVSGGEPLLQLEFLKAILEECKDKNIHTAIDTCGYTSNDVFKKISDHVDLFLYDIKMMDDNEHRRYTGVPNKQILENFKSLARNGSDILVRFPIIPGINDSEDNVTKTAEFVLTYGVKNINLLPYNRAGIEKYRGLNKSYKLKTTPSASDENLRSIKERLETLGLRVKIGGG